jgi:Zn-dependent protease
VDPIGTVALPMVLAVSGAPVFGWAKPVPVVAAKLRSPRLHMMLVALAGPGINFLLAILSALALAILLGAGPTDGLLGAFLVANLQNLVVLNIFLGVFNLLPMPPFDGGHVVEGLLPRTLVPAWQRLGRAGLFLLIFLLLILPMLVPSANVVERFVVPPVRAITGFVLGLFGL